MKIVVVSRLLFIIALTLGMCVAYAGIRPITVDGGMPGGSCTCNWSDWKTCATSSGASGTCTSKYCEADGNGSGTVTSYTYCDGVKWCDETAGSTCSQGNDCVVSW